MADRIQLSDEQRRYLLDPRYLPNSICINDKIYTPEEPIHSGYKGVIWRVKDEFGRLRALKLCIYADYLDRSYLQEMTRASALERYREFASFVDAGLVEKSTGPLEKQKYVCFVEEWIDGLTLESFVRKQASVVTASFMLAYVRALCHALQELYSKVVDEVKKRAYPYSITINLRSLRRGRKDTLDETIYSLRS